MNVAAELIDGRYRIVRQIGAGGMGVVHEVADRLTGERVALKRVLPGRYGAETGNSTIAIPVNSDVMTLHLAREFQLLSSLRHPNIISVLDYGVEQSASAGGRNFYFAMELLPDARTILEAGQGASFEEKIRLIVELMEALAYLHRRGILHCDLKPENVLVSKSGRVKVVDFGLSSLRETVEDPESSGMPAGTLTYMSPERVRGGAATDSSDLYAAGVIAYQLLMGEYPYDKSTLAGLITAILNTEPDVTPLYRFETPAKATNGANGTNGAGHAGEIVLSDAPTLAGIVRRLLAKDPADRYAYARAVIADLAAAGLPVHPESRDVRESFLQAAQFVGRGAELHQLRLALSRALAGEGSAFLIGGESGIGKSRLLNELRTYALISGARVLTGQAVEGAGLVYQTWRDPLRRLALTTPLTTLQASILKALIPDIDTLLETSVPDAPPLEGDAESARLLRTIYDVVRLQTQPMLIILEDLQWARESLDVLRTLLPLTQTQPLMITGSYRNDEAAALPAELPGVTSIRLPHMTPDEIAALSRSMLGDAATPQLSDLLLRETEGNALFVVEFVRSLAEEAGTLDAVTAEPTPFRVMAGGIQAILRRRLGRVALDARPLLDAAAVAGRVIDPAVLTALIHANPDIAPAGSLDHWLRDCADAAVLEVANGQWRFAHDKLREVLIVDLIETGALPDISRKVAFGIESAYPDPADRATRAAALADHWRNAGDTDREADALETAGRVALDSALYAQAEEFHARALPLVKGDDVRTARLMARLAEAQYSLGEFLRPQDTALRALKLIGYNLTTDPVKQSRAMTPLLFRLAWRIARPRRPRTPGADDISLIALKALEQLTLVHYWQNQRAPTSYFSLYSVLVAEEVSTHRWLERAHGYATGATALGSSRRRLANLLRRRADHALRHVTDMNTNIWGALATGILQLINARWGEAEMRLSRSRDLARQVGSIRRFEESSMALAGAYYYSSQWDAGKAITTELYDMAKAQDNQQALAWALDNVGRYALREGRLDDAMRIFQQGLDIYEQVRDLNNIIWCQGAIAKTYLCMGEVDSARPYVEAVTKALRETPTTFSGMLEPFSAAAEYHLMIWERSRDFVEARVSEARAAVAAMGDYSGIFVLARPRYRAFLGWQRRLEGDTRAAIRIGKGAVRLAARLNMAYDEGIACVELARHYASGDARRVAWLNRAEAIFDRLGARYDLERTRLLLE